MLYEIEGKSARILGAMHAFLPGTVGLPSWVEEADQWATRLMREHDGAEFHAHRLLPAGQSLQAMLPVPAWLALVNVFIMDYEADRWKPWYASMRFTRAKLPLIPGVEAQLESRRNRPPDLTIESGREVAELFDAIPLDHWARALTNPEAIRDAPRYFRALHAAWASGDLEQFAAVPLPGGYVIPEEVNRLMLYIRNERWAERIQKMTFAKPTLIMVGAFHLAGANNFLDLLRAKGMVVRKLI